jgi:hypothetical protein
MKSIKPELIAHIHPSLRPYAVKVSSLHPDPENIRIHSKKNLQAIHDSLTKHGQVLPLVARTQNRVVKIGNGRLSLCAKLGWKYVACIFVDTDETMSQLLAVADNRTGELGQWDYERLTAFAQELMLEVPDIDLPALLHGFSDTDLSPLLSAVDYTPPAIDPSVLTDDQVEEHMMRISRGRMTGSTTLKDTCIELRKLLQARLPDQFAKASLADVVVYALQRCVKVEKKKLTP